MKIAVVAGGWHWPMDFYYKMSIQANGPHRWSGTADLFVIAHRDPELPIVREEKRRVLDTCYGPLGGLDRVLYSDYPRLSDLEMLGWNYIEAPNTVGDWEFLNQWLDHHEYRDYDVILSCHDDTYIRRYDLFEQLDGDWLILSNGRYPQAPEAYVRDSFEFFKREMIEMLGGRIDLGHISMTREGKTDSPAGLQALASWNDTGVPLRRFMVERHLSDRIAYLSDYYRISPWVIEAERGFLHYQDGAPWSFEEGLKRFPVGSMAQSFSDGVNAQ